MERHHYGKLVNFFDSHMSKSRIFFVFLWHVRFSSYLGLFTQVLHSTNRVRHRGLLLKGVAVQGVLYQSILNAKLTGRKKLGRKM